LTELRNDMPPALARVVERLMAKDPAKRYQTPAEVADALAPFAAGAPVKPRRPWRMLVAVASLAAAVLLAGAVIYVQTDQGEFVIETKDKDIAVMVNRQGVKISDPKTGREYLLKVGRQKVRTGDYVILPQLLTEDIAIEGGTVFTVKRGGQVV